MTLREAYNMLDAAPIGDTPSAVNPHLTKSIAVQIVRNAAATLGCPRGTTLGPDDLVDPITEKRVWQVFKNQVRPRY